MNNNFKNEFGSIIKQNESDFYKVMQDENFNNLKNQISKITANKEDHIRIQELSRNSQ